MNKLDPRKLAVDDIYENISYSNSEKGLVASLKRYFNIDDIWGEKRA